MGTVYVVLGGDLVQCVYATDPETGVIVIDRDFDPTGAPEDEVSMRNLDREALDTDIKEGKAVRVY